MSNILAAWEERYRIYARPINVRKKQRHPKLLVTVEIFESLRPLRIIFLAISIRGSTPLTQKYFYTVPASQYFQSLTSRPGETMIPKSKERIQPRYSLIQRRPACLNNLIIQGNGRSAVLFASRGSRGP